MQIAHIEHEVLNDKYCLSIVDQVEIATVEISFEQDSKVHATLNISDQNLNNTRYSNRATMLSYIMFSLERAFLSEHETYVDIQTPIEVSIFA